VKLARLSSQLNTTNGNLESVIQSTVSNVRGYAAKLGVSARVRVRVKDSGFRIQDSGFRIQDSGFRILV